MKKNRMIPLMILVHCLSFGIVEASDRPPSPRGQAAMEVPEKDVSSPWKKGKWVELDYGRPLLRGRESIFGTGASYGETVRGGAPVWRAGANQTTRLTTETGLLVGGTQVAPGVYSVFIELKEEGWTLILSRQPAAEKYTPADVTKLWGSHGYDPKFVLARAPMTLSRSSVAVEQLAMEFVDVTPSEAKLRVSWDKTTATVPLKILH